MVSVRAVRVRQREDGWAQFDFVFVRQLAKNSHVCAVVDMAAARAAAAVRVRAAAAAAAAALEVQEALVLVL